jgi:hypothetical protein
MTDEQFDRYFLRMSTRWTVIGAALAVGTLCLLKLRGLLEPAGWMTIWLAVPSGFCVFWLVLFTILLRDRMRRRTRQKDRA